VTKAAEDARSLVKSLTASDDLNTALEHYQTDRLAIGKQIVARARGLGAYMQAQISTPHERAMAEKYRSVEVVMAETAVSLLGVKKKNAQFLIYQRYAAWVRCPDPALKKALVITNEGFAYLVARVESNRVEDG
jgi:hypothetical protein